MTTLVDLRETTAATPAERKLRIWAASHSPEVQAAAERLAMALYLCAGRAPPDAVAKAELLKRKAEFDRAVAQESGA